MDGEAVSIIHDEKRIALVYNHKHRREMVLNIKISR
jgi:hypothetical protein